MVEIVQKRNSLHDYVINLQGYDFQSKPRRYRAYETCGRLNSHKWSVGYVDDHLLIAKC